MRLVRLVRLVRLRWEIRRPNMMGCEKEKGTQEGNYEKDLDV